MLFSPPPITAELRRQLDEVAALHAALARAVAGPERPAGALRRSARAAAIRGSTAIEGYTVEPDELQRLSAGAPPRQPADADQQAVACYARALDHVAALADDPRFRWSDRVILDLHFDACWFQPDKRPGRWRSGPIGVTGADGELEFRGPDAELVPGLIAELVASLVDADSNEDLIVRAALAHLNLTSIHPFADGNGRLARILQSLVLARESEAPAELLSIEAHLAGDTPRYYAALRQAQDGSFNPQRDTSAWVAFCVEAHLAAAHERLRQAEAATA